MTHLPALAAWRCHGCSRMFRQTALYRGLCPGCHFDKMKERQANDHP